MLFLNGLSGMSRLADETRGCCKFSGIVTEAGNGWTIDDLRPFAEHVLSALLAQTGSCGDQIGLFAVYAGRIWRMARHRAGINARRLSEADRTEVFGGTAARFYRLS